MSSPPAARRKRHLTSDPGSGWASLPEDLLGLVASLFLAGDLLDYVRFRAVCTAWRSGTADPRGRGIADPRFHPRRWMMLPEGHYLYPGHPNLGGFIRFLNLDTGVLVRARIPFLGVGNFWPIDSVDGLLLLLRDTVDQEGAVRLLHPFTGDIVELPPIGTLASSLLSKCPATSVSFNAAGTVTVMLVLHGVDRIAFATSRDRQWTLSPRPREFPELLFPSLSFQGNLYVMHTSSRSVWDDDKIHHVLQVDPPVTLDDGGLAPPQFKSVATIPSSKLVNPVSLVECGSEILVLGRNDWSAQQIIIYKLADIVLQRFIPIESIGGKTLFFKERGISVSSRALPTVRGDICKGPPHLAQYNLSSGTLSPAIDTCSLYGRAQGPSNLVHYIFSCCIRDPWSKGLIFRRTAQDWSLPDEEEQV